MTRALIAADPLDPKWDIDATLDDMFATSPVLTGRIEDALDWLASDERRNPGPTGWKWTWTQFTTGHRQITVHGDGQTWHLIWSDVSETEVLIHALIPARG